MRFINALVACSVIAITSSSVLAQSTAVQWTTASGGNGHWYSVRVFTSELTPSEYFDLATAIGGYGASITNQAEDEFVYQLSVATPGGWSVCGLGPLLGGGRLSGCNFTWLTGEPWGYTSWGPADPSHCGEQFLQYCVCGQSSECARRWWIDTDMTVKPSGVIEWSADCNADGIVDYGQCHDGSLPDYNGNNIPDCCEQGVACVAGSYPVCWRIEDGGNGHWYDVVIHEPISWETARLSAEAKGGYLATPVTAAENLFVSNVVASVPAASNGGWGPRIGGSQSPSGPEPAGGWMWLSNERWQWTNWMPGVGPNDPGEPNDNCPGSEDYLMFYIDSPTVLGNGYRWNDTTDAGDCWGVPHRSFIIEYSADCNSDGIVDYGQILSGELIDANSNGIPDSCEVDPCPGDISGNGAVDGVDLTLLLGVWGTDGIGGKFDADITNDGIVGGADLTVLFSGWGPCPN